jgi:hypothetical protein
MRIEILSDAEDDLVAGAKFPFAIFYRFERDKELIRVYRVLDLRRDPLWIRERLR